MSASANFQGSVFGQTYARAYNALYENKNYEAECDFIEAIFRRFDISPRSLLDLGCGTGGHVFPLAKRGYEVVGVDRSPSMLDVAQQNADSLGLSVELHRGDIRELKLGRTFDAVISMFAVMGYQTTNADLIGACQTARRHLQPGGVFVFDAWYGPGVLADRPTERVRVINSNAEQIIRVTQPVLDTTEQIVETNFRLWSITNGQVTAETAESHRMRFFFPQEIRFFLQQAGFGRIELMPFLELDQPVSDRVWNVTVVAVAE